jgi:hypothetical protein
MPCNAVHGWLDGAWAGRRGLPAFQGLTTVGCWQACLEPDKPVAVQDADCYQRDK